MKKTIIIFVCVVCALLLVSVAVIASQEDARSAFLRFFKESKTFQENDAVAVTVNGDPIYESEIKTELSFSELSSNLAINQITDMDVDEDTKNALIAQQKSSQKTQETIVEDLIQEKVLLQEAKRRGVSVSEDAARAVAVEQYELAKKAAASSDSLADKRNYEFVLTYIEETGLTEEQYIDLTVKVYQKSLIIDGLYELLAKSFPDSVDENGFTPAYLHSLVSQANIVYEK